MNLYLLAAYLKKTLSNENKNATLETILHHEGGYVNHPKDPGGETNLGVTKRVYEEWGGTKDMKDLTVADVAPIYKKNYSHEHYTKKLFYSYKS